MSDLGKTAAEWRELLAEEFAGLILAPLRELREIEDKFRLERTQVVSLNDVASATPHLVACDVAGVLYGVNCSPEGRLWVRITGSGPYTVTFYKAAGGGSGDKVAEGSGAAGATVSLTPQNSSGLSATVELGSTITADTSDNHQLLLFVDYPARLAKVLTQDGSVPQDSYVRRDLVAAYAQVVTHLRRAREVMRTAAARWALATDGLVQSRGNAFTRTTYTQLANEVLAEDGSGNVTRSLSGWIPFLADAMADETTGGEQDVVGRVLTAGAAVFDDANSGQGVVDAHTPGEHAIPGRWLFECVDDEIGRERFSYQFVSDDGRIVEQGTNGPVVGRLWSGPRGFGPIVVERSLSKTNDAGDDVFAPASDCTVTGPTSANTSDGDLFAKVEANGLNFDVSFYRASSRHASTLVAKAVNVAAGENFTAEPQNASGLTINWALGGTPSAVEDITLQLHPFKRENASRRADRFTIDVELADGAGLIQTLTVEEFGAALNSDTAGSESISDGYAMAGTFVPFL